MPHSYNCYSSHKLDSETNSGSCCKRRLLGRGLDGLFGFSVEECDSSSRDLHAVSARVSSGLRIKGFLHAVHIVELQLYDLVVSRVTAWGAADLAHCAFLVSRQFLCDEVV